MEQFWSMRALGWRGSFLPCAVTMHCWLSSGLRTKNLQFWKTAAASPNTKSIVPDGAITVKLALGVGVEGVLVSVHGAVVED